MTGLVTDSIELLVIIIAILYLLVKYKGRYRDISSNSVLQLTLMLVQAILFWINDVYMVANDIVFWIR